MAAAFVGGHDHTVPTEPTTVTVATVPTIRFQLRKAFQHDRGRLGDARADIGRDVHGEAVEATAHGGFALSDDAGRDLVVLGDFAGDLAFQRGQAVGRGVVTGSGDRAGHHATGDEAGRRAMEFS